jgi:hypothetical protein
MKKSLENGTVEASAAALSHSIVVYMVLAAHVVICGETMAMAHTSVLRVGFLTIPWPAHSSGFKLSPANKSFEVILD